MNPQAGEILIFNKPYRWTSFNVVAKVRGELSHRLGVKKLKVGHAGTLDPLATGVLIICTGKSTKLIDELQAHTKEYVATIKLGATTPSFDMETPEDATYPTTHITREMVEEKLKAFLGRIEQTPPTFSAVKLDGKRAFKYARKGEEVELLRYNFQTGKSEMSGKKLQLRENDLLVMEGIHALNPELTAQIPDEQKFRVYASALTTILLDTHNYIPTTDNRLLRRIIRDVKYRGCSAADTIRRWPSVRAGENKWIFPYQENADAMFNTAMIYELGAIKTQAEAALEQVPENCDEYAEAYRLRMFLKYFVSIPYDMLPPISLLREFLGGSSFSY